MISYIKKRINDKPVKLIIMFFAFMVIAYVSSYLFTCIKYSSFVPINHFLKNAFTISDAKNYIYIAENGYVKTGNYKYLLVFFPIYPLMISLLHFVSFFNYSICAFIISLVSSCISIVLLYKIVLIDYDEDTAFNTGLVYIMYPVSTFLVTGLNESVFLMLLFATVYCVRKNKFIHAGIFGYLVALTRLPGLCIGAYMFVETIIYVFTSIKKNSFKASIILKQCIMMFMTLMGLCTYLIINYVLHGDFLKFLEFQRDIWYQVPTNFLRVIFDVIPNGQIAYGMNVIGYSNLIACIVMFTAILYGIYKKVQPSYLIYTIVYFIVCYSASWLLSGSRYSMGAFLIYITTGIFLNNNKVLKIVFYIFYFLLFLLTSYLCTNCLLF